MNENNDDFWNRIGSRMAVVAALLAAGSFLFAAAFSDADSTILTSLFMLSGLVCALSAVSIVIMYSDEIFETSFYKSMEKLSSEISLFPSRKLGVFFIALAVVLSIGAGTNDVYAGKETESIIYVMLILIASFLLVLLSDLIFKAAFTKKISRYLVVYIVSLGALSTFIVPMAASKKDDMMERESSRYSWCAVMLESKMTKESELRTACLATAMRRLEHLSKP